MLLTNARIYTLDAAGTIADTLVVRDGRIAFVGRRADVNPDVGEAVHDLGGRAVLPGLVDAHGHLMHLARGRLSFDARGLAVRGGDRPPRRRARGRAAARRVDQPDGTGIRISGPAARFPRRPRSIGRRPSTRWPWCASTGTPRGRTRPRWPPPASIATRPIRSGGIIVRDDAAASHRAPDRHRAVTAAGGRAAAVGRAVRPRRARVHRRLPGRRPHRHPRDGRRAVRAGLLPAPARARRVPVPQLRGGGAALGVDVVVLPRARPGELRRRRTADGRRA